ncbi:hypothetical protein M514_03537 [Trichuris suis]|uniref:Uncharacterized protein n=1 Tax=Trichuris suis TaxID=68888 RepID=A0A085ME39_9BILA|nr:hypothetical protein M513_03537 [Trichuris suis]KFD71288.1 hypothetical protein M514_03537 [Trichuris suis]
MDKLDAHHKKLISLIICHEKSVGVQSVNAKYRELERYSRTLLSGKRNRTNIMEETALNIMLFMCGKGAS